MDDTLVIPQDLEGCQNLVRGLWSLQIELSETCQSLRASQEKLQQENEELQLTIKYLLRQKYGRHSERFVESPGQLHFDFGDDDSDPSIVSAAEQDPIIQEFLVRRRKGGRKPRNEKLPDHIERRTKRIEPQLPPGVGLEECVLIGIDVVEILELDRPQLWVQRIEYPKYKLPGWALSPRVAEDSPAETAQEDQVVLEVEATIEPEAVVEAEAAVEMEAVAAPETLLDAEMLEGEPAMHSQLGEPDSTARQAEPVPRAEPIAHCPSESQPAWQAPPSSGTPTSAQSSPTEHACDTAPVVEARGILQAPREITLIEGGRFGFSVATEVLYSKFGLHVPLYRQQDSFAQLGWSPNRSTLCLIVTHCAELFRPLAERFRHCVLSKDVLGTDDTPVTLLTPGEGDGSRQARFWLYRGRDGAPYDVFAFTNSRQRDGPDQFLEPFRGILTGDCYSGYVNIEQVTQGRIKFSACLSHARRYVFDAREQHPVLGSQMLAVIQQLYDIEDQGRTMDAAQRLELRQRQSVPLMNRLRNLLDSDQAGNVLPKSRFGKALGYLRNHWSAFQVFLQDGRVPIDNNDVERDLRRIAVGRDNWLFVGSQEAGVRTATIYTVMASAHRHDLDVWAYVRDALETLARGRAAAGGDIDKIDPGILESLLPDVWAQAHPESIRTFRTNEKQQRAETRRFKRAQRRHARAQASGQ
jgi:transposase